MSDHQRLIDPSATLLERHVKVRAGDTVLNMNCGNGMFAFAAAAAGAARILLTDRNIVAVEAARRTIAQNGVANADVFVGHGAYAIPGDVSVDLAVIRLPQENLSRLQLLADAFHCLTVGGRCYVAGATNEGVKSMARTMADVFGDVQAVAHGSGHRVLLSTKRSATPASDILDDPLLAPDAFHIIHATLRGRDVTLHARPGVFSWEHLDEATALLADVMQVNDGDNVLDLGCGTGALGIVAAMLTPSGVVTMVDADVEAVRSAAWSAEANALSNVTALPSDAGDAVGDRRFDVVVTNPPFHLGKATDLGLPFRFIRDAHAVLAPGGRLYLVANRTLPYEREVLRVFGNVATAHDGARFKVLTASATAK